MTCQKVGYNASQGGYPYKKRTFEREKRLISMSICDALARFSRVLFGSADIPSMGTANAVASPRGRTVAFRFNTRKTIQAVGVLLKQKSGRRDNYMRVLKLLYAADRDSIQETGAPITGDNVVAMRRGPVLSGVLHLIKGEHISAGDWDRAIRKDAYDIELIDDPGVDELSRYEVRKLHEISKRYADKDEWAMVRLTHKFPEWQKNKPTGNTCETIPLEDILDAVGRGADKETILREAAYAREVDRLFGSSST